MYDKNVDMADADEVLLKALEESVAIASGNVERSGDVEAAADVARPSTRGDLSEWQKQGVFGRWDKLGDQPYKGADYWRKHSTYTYSYGEQPHVELLADGTIAEPKPSHVHGGYDYYSGSGGSVKPIAKQGYDDYSGRGGQGCDDASGNVGVVKPSSSMRGKSKATPKPSSRSSGSGQEYDARPMPSRKASGSGQEYDDTTDEEEDAESLVSADDEDHYGTLG